MMDHKEIEGKEIIERYILGKLSASEIEDFEEHLFFCAKCMDELEQKEVIIDAIRIAAENEIISKEQSNSIIKKPKRKNIYYLYALLAVAASLAIIVYIFALQFFHKDSAMKVCRNTNSVKINKEVKQNKAPDKNSIVPKNPIYYTDTIKSRQENIERNFANNLKLDSAIGEELAYAEVRGIQEVPTLIDPVPEDNKKYKVGEEILFKWSCNYQSMLYKFIIYNNKGDKVHYREGIKSIQAVGEYKFKTFTLKPGLYYWQVIPPKK